MNSARPGLHQHCLDVNHPAERMQVVVHDNSCMRLAVWRLNSGMFV
jgi:hypothetical protein